MSNLSCAKYKKKTSKYKKKLKIHNLHQKFSLEAYFQVNKLFLVLILFNKKIF